MYFCLAYFQGSEDHWIQIQQNTFKNWVNAQLQKLDLKVDDLQTDFCDGLKLCYLMEVLQVTTNQSSSLHLNYKTWLSTPPPSPEDFSKSQSRHV